MWTWEDFQINKWGDNKMANIDKDTNVFIGFQGTSNGCAEINSTDLAGNVTVIYGILKGDQFDDRSPSVADNIFTNFNKFSHL